MEIAGGKLTIDAAGDGVNCTGSLELQAGEVDVTSAEDGIQADGDLTVSGGAVTITTTGTVAASAQDDFQPNNFGGGNPPSGDMPPETRRSCRTAKPLAAAISAVTATHRPTMQTTARTPQPVMPVRFRQQLCRPPQIPPQTQEHLRQLPRPLLRKMPPARASSAAAT